jgi:uroporphyrinogen-III synthase
VTDHSTEPGAVRSASVPAQWVGPDSVASLPVDLLRGFRIGVTSDRRSHDLIAALQRRGAHVVHAPSLKIAPHDQDLQLIAETRELIKDCPELVLITTGYGMRRWFEVADAAGLGHELSAVLDSTRILARGPKALGAVRAAGLEAATASDQDTTASLIDKIIAEGLVGRRVALQQHGYTDDVQLARLCDVSHSVRTITPYRWVSPGSNDRLARLIGLGAERQLDAITFTSAPGADATLAAAREMGRADDLIAAMRNREVVAAAVGPVTASPLHEVGIEPIIPDRHRLGALIRLISDYLDRHGVQRLHAAGIDLELRGRSVRIGDRVVTLGPTALALLRMLATSNGVVSRSELMKCLPDAPDDHHALEVAMSRLRRSLGEPGLITTVVKRGYRLGS